MRGGIQNKLKYKHGDQALLAAIWESHGGPTEVARVISEYAEEEVHRQAPINWRMRGQVPHRYVKIVADALQINPIGLNYKTLMNLTPDIPAWDKVVRSYNLPKDVVRRILFLKPPGAKK